jgi:hypothetical protein
MKKLLVVAVAALLSGCTSKPYAGNPHPGWLVAQQGDNKPHVGMQMGDISRLYGSPQIIRRTEAGQQWEYNDFRKLWIPFRFNFKVHIETFNFDTHGVLTSFNVDY